MITLPAEQDRLLKELNNIDAQDRLGIRPERNNINIFLVILIWLFGIIISVITIFNHQSFYVSRIILFCSSISIGLIGAFYNKTWGFYIACICALAFNIYANLQYPRYHSDVTTLMDGLTIFIFANQFGKYGYVTGLTIILAKVSYIFFQYGELYNIDNYFATMINVISLGFLPVLLESISKFSRKARKQEIRAEILSLQNQDLLGSWQDFYTNEPKQSSPTAEPQASTSTPTKTQQQSLPENQEDITTQDLGYISPYTTDSTDNK